jgi:hypothetical protein
MKERKKKTNKPSLNLTLPLKGGCSPLKPPLLGIKYVFKIIYNKFFHLKN